MSVLPPGGKGTIKRIGRHGEACGETTALTHPSAKPSAWAHAQVRSRTRTPIRFVMKPLLLIEKRESVKSALDASKGRFAHKELSMDLETVKLSISDHIATVVMDRPP